MRHAGMGEVNEYLVLEYLRGHRPTTRPQVAAELGLSQASVSRIVAKLLARGLVVESPGKSVAGGRPRTLLDLNPGAGSVVGIDLGGTRCHGVLADLHGGVLDEAELALDEARNAYDALARVWKKLAAAAKRRGLALGALAVGVPAVIEPETGLAVRGPNVGWEGFNLVERVRAFGLPFIVDNDVNLAASAEGRLGEARGVRDFAVLSIGTGLGGAVVADGRLVRGRHNAAGELAALLPRLSMVRDRRIGGLGAMETILSAPAIAARALALVASDPRAREELGARPSARRVIERALAGGIAARQIVAELVEAVALTVVALSAVVDPEVIVFDGSIGRALAPFLPRVAEFVALHIATPPRLAVSTLGPNATVQGAIVAALQLRHDHAMPLALTQLIAETGESA
ncbi:MAG: ROK family transcriptional regulator [Burkholderiales bacterium]|nr:ROK family transcriptional regulator [Burkholderiales bacterium]